MRPPDESAARPDQATTEEALRFSGVVLPATAQVLGVKHEKGIDQIYTLAITVDQDSIAALLDESDFTIALQPGRRVFLPPVEGFDPTTSTDVASAQDKLKPTDGRTATVTRDILVDRGDPHRPVVHIWAYTT